MSKDSYPKNPTYYQYQQQAMPTAPQVVPGSNPNYPPPPYSYAAGVPAPAQPYPMANPHMMVSAPGYNPYAQPQGYAHPANPGYPIQQGFNYAQPTMAMAQFDSGARFDGIATHNIPPPPPGCAPNAAQMASAQGGPVITTQQKANWFSGGSGGGVSFW